MRYAMKVLLMAGVIAASCLAEKADAATYTGTSTWRFSDQLMQVAGIPVYMPYPNEVDFIDVSGVQGATVVEERQFDVDLGYDSLVSVKGSSPVSGVQLTPEGSIASVQNDGGILLTSIKSSGLALGGQISLTDFAIDLSNKRVYATITGNFTGAAAHVAAALNNSTVSTIEDFYLFDYYTSALAVQGDTSTLTFSGLTITTEGMYHIRSALRLVLIGTNAWNSIAEYGSITTTITAVPEPATLGMGLAGVAIIAAARRMRRG